MIVKTLLVHQLKCTSIPTKEINILPLIMNPTKLIPLVAEDNQKEKDRNFDWA
jgi:hypothetical protein